MNENAAVTDDATPSQPDGLQATSLEASLTVTNLQQSLAWYSDILGLVVDRNHEREGRLIAVAMKAGLVRILLSQDDGTKGADRVKGAGISLHFTTAQDIDTLATRIKTWGGTLESEPVTLPWGPRMFRVRDPDGFRFTISSGIRSD
jgi:uncharacterized glyoxalase superfamily protein PhnB